MTDLAEVWSQIKKVNYGFLWLFFASFIAYLSGCLSWTYCFKNPSKVSVQRLFYVRTVGELITLFNPTNIIAGEASKFYLLKDVALPNEDKIDSILLSRIVLIISQIVLIIFCCFWVSYFYKNSFFLVCGIVIICLLMLIIFGLKNGNLLKLFGQSRFRYIRLYNIKLIHIQSRIKAFICDHKIKVALSLLFASLHWLCGAVEIYIILFYLGLDPLLMQCIIVDTGVVLLKSIAGFVPGQIGVEELSNKSLLSLVGFQGVGIWLTVSLLRRAKQFIWICISGFFYVIDQILFNHKKIENGNIVCDT